MCDVSCVSCIVTVVIVTIVIGTEVLVTVVIVTVEIVTVVVTALLFQRLSVFTPRHHSRQRTEWRRVQDGI